MDDLEAAVSLLSALGDALSGPLQRLRTRLPEDSQPTGPAVRLFTVDGRSDAGVAIDLSALRGDGRLVQWTVEVWIYSAGLNEWQVNIKAEIDLDSDDEDRCVLNEQQIISDPQAVAEAISHAARLVLDYPTSDILTAGWVPADWSEGEPQAER